MAIGALVCAPLVPLAWWILLAVLAAVLWLWYAVGSRRRVPFARWLSMLGLMALAMALPLALLLNPTWVERLPPPSGKPLLTVLLDDSASMATPDAPHGATRFAAGRKFVSELAAAQGNRFEIRIKTFARQTHAVEGNQLPLQSADGQSTDLARAIREAPDDDRPQGQALVLVSDGIDNVAGAAAVLRSAERAKALAAPIFACTLGGSADARDLDVELSAPQELAFIGQRVSVRVVLGQRGLAGARTLLKLTSDGRMLDSRPVVLSAKRDSEVTFEVSRPTAGLFRFEVSADPIPGEVTAANNTATLLVRVVDEPIRVLLVEGKPYWDTRFLVRALAADPSLELVSLVRLTDDRILEQKFARSATESKGAQAGVKAEQAGAKGDAAGEKTGGEKAGGGKRAETWRIVHSAGSADILASLDKFQIIVLGRDTDSFLDAQTVAGLKKWISATGGSLVCFRGSPEARVSQALSPVLPVRWTPARESRFRVRWTAAGKQLGWLSAVHQPDDDALAGLPSLATANDRDDRKPLAVVLAAALAEDGQPGQPVITYQPFGSGRTVVVEGAGMWRWAFFAPREKTSDPLYAALWQSLVRWLVSHAGLLPGEERLLRPDKVCFDAAEPATATLLVSAAAARQEIPRIQLSIAGRPTVQAFTPIASPEEPRMFRVAFGPLAEGRYEAQIVGAPPAASSQRTTFDVRRNLRERIELAARPDLMAKIAAASGGAVLGSSDAGEVARRFDAHLGLARADRLARQTAWDRWWVLTGVCLVWASTWVVRRGGGLI
jgi:hypothetical protein